MTLDGKILSGHFKHERLKSTIIRSQGNVQELAELRQIMNTNLRLNLNFKKFMPNQLVFMEFMTGYEIKHTE